MANPNDTTEKVLQFIKEYKRSNQGNSPSFDEIAEKCELAGRSNVKYHIEILQKEGKIVYKGARQIILCEPMEVTA